MAGYYGYNPYQQNYMQPQQMNPQQLNQPQIQNGGFISVRNETEARNYPVAPGNSITFKDETSPYIYTKTMGFSQLDRPNFEKYKLVKEDVVEPEVLAETTHNEIDSLKQEIDKLWGEINAIKEPPKKPTTRKKEEGDV